MRAVPGGLDALQIPLELLVGVALREHGVAVGERHGAALGMARGELHRDRGAGVPPVGRDLLDAEGVERLGERIGEILHRRRGDRQLVRQAEARRVQGEAGELLGEDGHERAHHLRRARRGVQQRERRPAAGAQVVDTPRPDRHEMPCDVHQ